MTASESGLRLDREAELARSIESAPGWPEHAFGVTGLRLAGGGTVSGSMRASGTLLGPDGEPAAGAVAVLADDTLGFAAAAASPAPCWSMSIEISLDYLGPLPARTALHIRAQGTRVDAVTGYALGEIRDDSDEIVVHARHHGRIVPAPALGAAEPGQADPVAAATVTELLGARVDRTGGAPALVIDDPDPWVSPLGALHGGVAISATEAAATYATSGSSVPLRTTSLTVAFTRPLRGGRPLTFQTRALHAGRTVRVVEVTGYADGVPCTFGRVIRQQRGAGTGP